LSPSTSLAVIDPALATSSLVERTVETLSAAIFGASLTAAIATFTVILSAALPSLAVKTKLSAPFLSAAGVYVYLPVAASMTTLPLVP